MPLFLKDSPSINSSKIKLCNFFSKLKKRNDVHLAISKYDQFDFLIDIVPREEKPKPSKKETSNAAAAAAAAASNVNMTQINTSPNSQQQQQQQQQQLLNMETRP